MMTDIEVACLAFIVSSALMFWGFMHMLNEKQKLLEKQGDIMETQGDLIDDLLARLDN